MILKRQVRALTLCVKRDVPFAAVNLSFIGDICVEFLFNAHYHFLLSAAFVGISDYWSC